jgi:hypothetical protein
VLENPLLAPVTRGGAPLDDSPLPASGRPRPLNRAFASALALESATARLVRPRGSAVRPGNGRSWRSRPAATVAGLRTVTPTKRSLNIGLSPHRGDWRASHPVRPLLRGSRQGNVERKRFMVRQGAIEVVRRFWGGDIGRFRQRGPKDFSSRHLGRTAPLLTSTLTTVRSTNSSI